MQNRNVRGGKPHLTADERRKLFRRLTRRMRFCPRCGWPLQEEANRCPDCELVFDELRKSGKPQQYS